jgi:ComEC/Rec2-related protein
MFPFDQGASESGGPVAPLAPTPMPDQKPFVLVGRRSARPTLGRRLRRLRSLIPVMLEEEAAHGHGFLFVPVLIGAGAAFWFSLPQDPPFWPLVAAFVILAVLSVFSRHQTSLLRLLPLVAALFIGGMMLAELETWRRATIILDSPVTTELSGVVERREIDASGRWRYIVHVRTTANPQVRRPPERVSLLARSKHEAVETGNTISGRVRISPPSGPALPRLNDFALSSYFDGIGAVGFFYGAPKAEAMTGASAGSPIDLKRWLFDLRGAIGTRIRETVPGDAGAFAAAIVTDERRAISEETTEALRLSGLAHIVAISGLNMALAAGIFFVGVRTVLSLFPGFAQAYPVKKIAAFGALVMVTAYYLISGFGVSAERAYIMMSVILVAVLFDRESISLRNVALSALIIIAMSPSELLGPSFQMSFAATAALVAGYAAWKGRLRGGDSKTALLRHRSVMPLNVAWNFAAGVMVTSLIGSVSTAMFSIDHFHRIATYGLAANLAAMPIISFVVMPAGLAGMLLMPFGLEAPFLKLMAMGLEAVIAIARHVAAWGGDVGVGRQHPWFLMLATVGFVILALMRTRLRLLGIPFLALALLLSWHEASAPLPDILVSEDGTMAALTGPAGIVTNRTQVPDFIYDQWRRALLLPEPGKPQISPGGETRSDGQDERRDLTQTEIETAGVAMKAARVGSFTCIIRAWCAVKSPEGVIVVAVEDGRYTGAACDAAGLVIAARARFDRCRSGALLLNGTILRKTGALEIFLAGATDPQHWRLNAAMAGQDRPWTRHRHYDWRSQVFDSRLPEPVRQLINGSGG